MLETVKNVMANLAAPTAGGFARSVAQGSVDVASRVGGLPEVVRDRETGLLVDNAAAAVAAAIGELAHDPALARRLGQAGRRAVIENFTLDHMVRRTMEVYQKVLS